jgi:Asp-tRNA(Asn)/Glu-tRNA(Gln) amidotransferase A subunit family amidase
MANTELYRLTASQVTAGIRSGEFTVEEYAKSLLSRIKERDATVKAWAYLNPEQVLEQARQLDKVPPGSRGPLHGVSVAVKDIIYTRDMPTQHNSPIYKDANAGRGTPSGVDAGTIMILRNAGALIVGKTATTEFAATTEGPATCNPHDTRRTPGGSSSGSGAAVADFQAAVALGSQTGGSIVRPGSFNGVYAFKPTWNSITREGQKVFSLILDTFGVYARSVEDLELLADVFELRDDVPPFRESGGQLSVKGAKLAFIKTMVWDDNVESGTESAMAKAVQLLRAHGAEVDEIEFPDELRDLPHWHTVIFRTDGRTAFLPDYLAAKDQVHKQLHEHVENIHGHTHAEQLEAFDRMAAARPKADALLSKYDAVLTPSVPGEAPLGLESTGSPIFQIIWTVSLIITVFLAGRVHN